MSISNFEIMGKLGEGSFSNVYKVRRRRDNKLYAMKKANFGPLKNKDKENALNEVRILASINSPNIIKYKEAFFNNAGKELCIVMEFAESGDLLKRISTHKRNRTSFSESEIWNALLQITSGLKALHDLSILHRDLKCANVFIGNNNQYKLGDLNVSKVNKGGMVYTQTGTPYYASPEVWKDQPYNASSDIWSLGCVIYEMATLSPPFTAPDMKGLYNKVIRGVYPPIPTSYSTKLSNVIRALLQVNPKLRPDCKKIMEMTPIKVDDPEKANALLGTIKMSYNISALEDRLPAARYEEKKDYPEITPRDVSSAASLKQRPEAPESNKNSYLRNYRPPPSVEYSHRRPPSYENLYVRDRHVEYSRRNEALQNNRRNHPISRNNENPSSKHIDSPFSKPPLNPYIKEYENLYRKQSENPHLRPSEDSGIKLTAKHHVRPSENPYVKPPENSYLSSENPNIKQTENPYLKNLERAYRRPPSIDKPGSREMRRMNRVASMLLENQRKPSVPHYPPGFLSPAGNRNANHQPERLPSHAYVPPTNPLRNVLHR